MFCFARFGWVWSENGKSETYNYTPARWRGSSRLKIQDAGGLVLTDVRRAMPTHRIKLRGDTLKKVLRQLFRTVVGSGPE
jgi:hypothetical protein